MRELKKDWRDIFCGFRIALDPKKMLLGLIWAFWFLLVVMVTLTWFVQEGSPLSQAVGDLVVNPGREIAQMGRSALAAVGIGAPAQRSAFCTGVKQWAAGAHAWGTGDWLRVLGGGAVWVLAGLLFWSWFGAPLLRMCAVQFAKDESVSFNEACAFSSGKRKSFFFAPLVPVIIALLMLVPVLVCGFLARIPWVGPIAAGLFLPLAILTGLFVVLTLIGGVFGCCLMGPTIATEGTDAFDAISRSFSYVYQKPWHYIWYWLVATAYGVVCVAFVALVAVLSIAIPLSVGGWAMGASYVEIRRFLASFQVWPSTAPLSIAAVLFKAWIIVTYGLVLGFAVSFAATASAIIYSLLRKDVDGTDMDEVYMEEEEEPAPEPAQAPQGMETPEPHAESAPVGTADEAGKGGLEETEDEDENDSGEAEQDAGDEDEDEEDEEEEQKAEQAPPAGAKKTAKRKRKTTKKKKRKTVRKKATRKKGTE